MIETKEREIDEMKIAVTQWPARKAFKYKRKLGYLFGPAIGDLVSGADMSGAEDDMLAGDFDLSKVGPAIEKLFDRLTDDEIDNIFSWMFSGVRINGVEMTGDLLDVTFAGKMLSTYKVMGFVLEVNFGSFLEKGSIGKLMARFQKTA